MSFSSSCAYCDAEAVYCERETGVCLCAAHAQLTVTGPRRKAPRPPLTIRPATSADRAGIAKLAEYVWGETEADCFDKSYQVDELPAYVACDGSEIVGVASYACEGDVVNLVMLDVLPRWQGRGVARKLISEVIDVARDAGLERVIVATTNDALPALQLYQRMGFTITEVLVGSMLEHHGGVELGFAGIPVRDEIRMELRL
jgi:GNAT superfamily N-acetyltransferase